MKTKVSRWGNSLALRLPKKLATSHGIFEESNVEILEREDGLLLRPSGRRTYGVDELLAKVSKTNPSSSTINPSKLTQRITETVAAAQPHGDQMSAKTR